MAHSDKNIVITPNIGSTTADPQIVFSGANASLGPQNITVSVYPTENGTLSFEGSAGQLFSITNSLSGTIFSVNDVSGIPSIEVLDTGLVKFAQYSGNVLIGTGTDNGTNKLQVAGTISATGTVTAPTFSGALSGNATTATTLQTARTIGGVSFNGSANINLPGVNTAGNQSTTGNAATATTLQTTRAINGTNFNGSAAITTANWGTARTIWGQSINGSANITAPVRPAAGSVTAPAFSTSGDTNTGIYFPAADTVGLSTNGTERVRINSTGNVIQTAQLYYDSITAVATAAGTTQATALALTNTINNITTVAASSGVRLPVPVQAGARMLIRNGGANILRIYPQTSAQINTLGLNVALQLEQGALIEFVAFSTTQWYTVNATFA